MTASRHRSGRSRRSLRRTSTTAAAVGIAVAGGLSYAQLREPPDVPTTTTPLRLTAQPQSDAGVLLPGSSVMGTALITNRGARPLVVDSAVFADPESGERGCRSPGVALAATVPPTPEAPLEVPAGGTAVLGWTAYMDGNGDHACQGSTLTSEVTLDGEPAGTVTLTAGTLEQPPAPVGGLTTSTRAAVHWSASTAADPGWVVERAPAGTDDWQPACGSSPARPVRALSCTDTGLSRSTAYSYRVTLRTGHWHATSRPSAPVITQERPSG